MDSCPHCGAAPEVRRGDHGVTVICATCGDEDTYAHGHTRAAAIDNWQEYVIDEMTGEAIRKRFDDADARIARLQAAVEDRNQALQLALLALVAADESDDLRGNDALAVTEAIVRIERVEPVS